MGKPDHLIELFFRTTLLAGVAIFVVILISQITHFITASLIYGFVLLIPISLMTAFYFTYNKLSFKNTMLFSILIIIVDVIVGVIVIKKFSTILVVEPSYVYAYAKQWINGPTQVLHALVWTHWGFYGLLLSKIFRIFGSSIFIMKMIGVCSVVVLNVFLVFLQKDLKEKNRVIFFALVLMSCYPLILLFLNFPTGDLIYIGLWGPVLYLFNKVAKNNLSFKIFILILLLASIILSIQNLFKDTMIVVLPILTVVVGFFLLRKKRIGRFILVPVFIIISFLIIQGFSVNYLEKYAGGIANSSKIGYFIATGTNQENTGLFNGDYYYNRYWGPINSAYVKGELSKDTYAKANIQMLDVAKVNIIDNFWSLPLLFVKKDVNIWSSDAPIIKQTSFDDPIFSGYKYTKMEPYRELFTSISDSLLILITIFFVVDCYYILRTKKYTFINTFCSVCVIGFFVAFTIMEGQPRYRIILMPLMIISASYGLDSFINWLRIRKNGFRLKRKTLNNNSNTKNRIN